ncbi:MAG: hypothetical protein LC749_11740, partial [Actinobacteria bacterium]|nr:hypothetical protein [Actinomycetota bacterium]
PYQETTPPRSFRLGERVQHRRQSHTMENRTNHREPENLENLHTDYRRPLATFRETISAVVGLQFYRLS